MSRTIAQRELRNDNASIIDAVIAGEHFIITRYGSPVAELRPVEEPRRSFVTAAQIVALSAQGPHLDRHRFERDLEREIDTAL